MTRFSYKEEINLTAGTRKSINLQSSHEPLFPPFSFYVAGAKKKEWATLFVFQLKLYCLEEKRQGNGEWVLDIAERKIFYSLETE